MTDGSITEGCGTYDYLIVGAGLTGSVFAHEATKRGKRCLVIDRREHVGGNVYTKVIDGITVHVYGPHIFHTDNKNVWRYVSSFVKFNDFVNCPVSMYKNETYNLPFNMNTFSKMWGVKTPEDARKMIEEQRKEIDREPRNLEEQAISMVGREIFEKLIKGYTEKQWGKECSELPAGIIKRIPVRFTFDNNYYDDRYQGIPSEGYTELIMKLLFGSDVRLNCDYSRDIGDFRKVAKKMVFTGMIDEYYGYVYGELGYRSLNFETRVEECDNYQGVAVVNYAEKEIPYTRIIEHKHFVNGKQPHTVISEEYPAKWERGLEAYYPIGSDKDMETYGKYRELASKEKDVIFCGRLGKYMYCDMDKAVEMALDIVEKELDS